MSIYVSSRVGRAFAPADKLSPSEWAERYRVLTAAAAVPGAYKMDLTPYMRGIIDAITDPTIRELAIMKSVQVGYSTMLQNLIGWTIDQEPGPSLLILPTEKAARAVMREYLQPLIDSTKQIQSRLRGDRYDKTTDTVNFDSMSLYMGSMGSPITMQGRAIRYVYIDEPDRGPLEVGEHGSPIEIARSRVTTFARMSKSKLVIGCTPSTPNNHINRQWEDSGDRRTYHVPCPFCGVYQRLVLSGLQWDYDDVKKISDRVKQSDYIRAEKRAAYECKDCRELIPSGLRDGMVSKGVWVSETQQVDKGGNLIGERPKTDRVAFHISALYSYYVPWYEVAARFVRAGTNRAALQVFYNETLGEPFKEKTTSVKLDDVRSASSGQPYGIVPKWASCLIASADTQGSSADSGYFYYVVRAWGRDRSQLVAFGRVENKDRLRQETLTKAYPVEGSTDIMVPLTLWIDSKGHRTQEIYDWARTDPRIRAVAGAAKGKAVRTSIPLMAIDQQLHTVNVNAFKDQLHAERQSRNWLTNDGATDDYIKQIAAEHKVIHKDGSSSWETKSVDAANHYLDCEVYNYAAASDLQTKTLEPDEIVIEKRNQAQKAREAIEAAQPVPQVFPPGPTPMQPQGRQWINTNQKSWL